MTLFEFTLLLCLAAVAASVQQGPPFFNGPCPPGWLYIQGSCYVYGERDSTWSEAQTFCQAAGATLVEIDNNDVNVALKTNFWQREAECIWLGGVNVLRQVDSLGNEGSSWQWISTSAPISQFQDWALGQPNIAGPGDYCLSKSQQVFYQWRRYPCSYKCNFICMKATKV